MDLRRDPPMVHDSLRTGRAYTLTEAAALAETHYQTAYRWIFGYRAEGHQMRPVFGSEPPVSEADARKISFLQLAELAVAVRFRRGVDGKQPVALDRLRRAHAYARQHLEVDYPFASLKLYSEGGHILHDFEDRYPGPGTLVLTMGGQWMLPLPVKEELDCFDFGEDDLAEVWHPYGKDVPVVVDPRIAAGSLTVAGTGVTLRTLQQRHARGESPEYLSEDYDIPTETIRRVLDLRAA